MFRSTDIIPGKNQFVPIQSGINLGRHKRRSTSLKFAEVIETDEFCAAIAGSLNGTKQKEKKNNPQTDHTGFCIAMAHGHTSAISNKTSATRLTDFFCKVDSGTRERIDPKTRPARNPPRCARTSDFRLSPKRTNKRVPASTPLIT